MKPPSYCVICDAPEDDCDHDGPRYLDPVIYEKRVLPSGRAVYLNTEETAESPTRDPESWRRQKPEPIKPPAWVHRWARARAAGDLRPFPRQARAMREMSYGTPDAPLSDRTAWVQNEEYEDDQAGQQSP